MADGLLVALENPVFWAPQPCTTVRHSTFDELGAFVGEHDTLPKKVECSSINVRYRECGAASSVCPDRPLWAEAVWKLAFLVDFCRSAGDQHGGFH
jgi:hypothetical protein